MEGLRFWAGFPGGLHDAAGAGEVPLRRDRATSHSCGGHVERRPEVLGCVAQCRRTGCFEQPTTLSDGVGTRSAEDRTADIAAIDCVTFAFVREHLPELAGGVREIGVTASAPGLPFIASNALPADAATLLADALDDAVRVHPELARRLKLKGFVRRPAGDYQSILAMEGAAIERGYPVLA